MIGSRTLAEMRTEDAGYIIRRRAVTEWERELNAQAVRVLARDGLVLQEVEMQAQRKLAAEEVAAYHDERAKIEARTSLD